MFWLWEGQALSMIVSSWRYNFLKRDVLFRPAPSIRSSSWKSRCWISRLSCFNLSAGFLCRCTTVVWPPPVATSVRPTRSNSNASSRVGITLLLLNHSPSSIWTFKYRWMPQRWAAAARIIGFLMPSSLRRFFLGRCWDGIASKWYRGDGAIRKSSSPSSS